MLLEISSVNDPLTGFLKYIMNIDTQGITRKYEGYSD
jgi:hypothetical protein